ncbi:MAG TPA: efflux RND transporter periplasmic adaptor subunit [Vicinamibacterales bacterium]|nr:efflux RND transporter periplasmic adaptor subunit [Vicinamibacterales bacterium]
MESQRWLTALAVSAALCAGACTQSTPEEVESEAVVPVRTAAAEKGTIRGVVHATGLVTPAPGAELIVVAPEAARVAEIHLGEGERVKRGDVLVRFEIPGTAAEVERQSAEVKRAQAALANATANETRARDLFTRGVAARKEVEDAERQIADAQAAVAQAEASRTAAQTVATRSVVHATFDGLVAKRYHSPGDVVEATASDPVLRVIDPQRLEVVASVPLTDVTRVVLGAGARLAGRSAGDSNVALKVVSRPSAVDPGTATIPVRLGFVRPTNLPAGAPVQVDIDAEKHDGVVVVPDSAIVREGEETAVFVVTDNKAARHEVKIGLSDGMRTEILSGVSAGDQVIVEGQAGLPDGAAVTTAKPEDDEPAKEDK